ncbi:MAG TPA: hypothetical protein VGL03_11590 [Thermoanaerobaculia bacterium]
MNKEKILGVLILADLAVTVSALVLDRVLEPFLPPPLRAYATAHSVERLRAEDWRSVLWIAVLVGTVLAWVGLLNLLKAARPLYVASWVGYLVLVASRGPTVSSPVGYALDLVIALVGGMIVAVVYFSELGARFRSIRRAPEEPLEAAV